MDNLKVPTGNMGGSLAGVIGQNVSGTGVNRFEPSPDVSGINKRLTTLLDTSRQTLPGLPEPVQPDMGSLRSLAGQSVNLPSTRRNRLLSLVSPREIPQPRLELSQEEKESRKQQEIQLTQQIRDALSARGINVSEAGASIEARERLKLIQGFAETDFNRARAIAAEDLNRAQLDLQKSQAIFSQEFTAAQFGMSQDQFELNKLNLQTQLEQRLFENQMNVIKLELAQNKNIFNQNLQLEAVRQGRETELLNRQLSIIDRALNQANIKFNQEQTEFTTNLAAAGVPVQQALEFMTLAQRGNMAAANIKLQQMQLDQEARNAVMGMVGGLFQGLGQAAGTVAGVALL